MKVSIPHTTGGRIAEAGSTTPWVVETMGEVAGVQAVAEVCWGALVERERVLGRPRKRWLLPNRASRFREEGAKFVDDVDAACAVALGTAVGKELPLTFSASAVDWA